MMALPEIYLLSAAGALPGPAVDNARLAALFGADELWQQWVDAFIGTASRHFAVDLETNEVRCWLADLGADAARQALSEAEVEPRQVDVVVLATSTPDDLMPATVNLIADRLGIDGIPTFQLQSGCAGAFQALEVARQMLLSGRHTTALVIGGDVCAKLLDVDVDRSQLRPDDMVNVALFGDAAGATVLSVRPRSGVPVLRYVDVRVAGLGRAPGHTVRWRGPAVRDEGAPAASEDYKAIEENVPAMAATAMRRALAGVEWTDTDVDYLLPPQLSGRMTAKITQRLDLPGAKEISCVRETGNTGNALPFLQLERLLPVISPGERAVGVAVESSKWIEAAFAVEGG